MNGKISHSFVEKQFSRARQNIGKSKQIVAPATHAKILEDLQKVYGEWISGWDAEIRKQTTEINRIDIASAINLTPALLAAETKIQTMATTQMTACTALREILRTHGKNLNTVWAKLEAVFDQKRTEMKNKV